MKVIKDNFKNYNQESYEQMDNLLINENNLLLMGILNITPDSFSDGGKYLKQVDFTSRLIKLIEDKTDIIDIGAESTKPGTKLISEEEELFRLTPFLEDMKNLPFTNIYFSLDTRKPQIAQKALENGFQLINDVSSLEYEAPNKDNLAQTMAAFPDRFLILNHHRGIPPAQSFLESNSQIIEEITEFFERKIDFALKQGMKRKQIILDPGLGFGKSPSENIFILNNLEKIKTHFALPILIGPSRKRFVQSLWNLTLNSQFADLDWASCVVSALALNKGVNIIRCHEPSLFMGLKEIKKMLNPNI